MEQVEKTVCVGGETEVARGKENDECIFQMPGAANTTQKAHLSPKNATSPKSKHLNRVPTGDTQCDEADVKQVWTRQTEQWWKARKNI